MAGWDLFWTGWASGLWAVWTVVVGGVLYVGLVPGLWVVGYGLWVMGYVWDVE